MNTELIIGAIYRFTRTSELRYYRAACTQSGAEFLYPISVDGSRMAGTHGNGRPYVLLYFMTKWGKLAAGGYWLNPKKAFDKVYVTDATLDDLELIAHDLAELAVVHDELDDILNRDEIELDMEIWGELLAD
ncbi:MAG: hypothetical protein AAF702_27900 [Chloroflexota bacterium]